MKSDTERKRYYKERLHKRKNRLHVHLSKDLRGKLKTKKRAIMLHKNDRVKIMRGPEKGKEAKVSRISVLKRKAYLEGIAGRNARGKEVGLALEPSNLLLIGLEPTEERKKIFKEEAFKKDAPKEEKKLEVSQSELKHEEKKEHKHEHKKEEHKEQKPHTESKPEVTVNSEPGHKKSEHPDVSHPSKGVHHSSGTQK